MSPFFNSHMAKTLIAFLFIIVIIVGGFLLLRSTPKTVENSLPVPAEGSIVIRGILTCLPHRDTSGPQTLECAFGLQAEDGQYYALKDTDPLYSNVGGTPMNVVVEVTGNFTPMHDEKYQSIGIIEVTNISAPQVPERVTMTGTYVCLPHKDTSGPQTEECAYGLQTEGGIYYALDFALLSQGIPEISAGDRISVSGVIIPIEALSSDHWQRYPVGGMFSVTDFDIKL